jgi:hypothetical protein
MFDEFGDPIDTEFNGSFTSADAADDAGFGGQAGSGGFDFSGLGGLGMVKTGLGSQLLGGVGRGATAVGGMAMRAGGRAARYIVTSAGQFSIAKTWDVAKRFGPEVAAAAIGMTVGDLMAVFSSSGVMWKSTRRRRRGISSRDIRTTRRVVRFTSKLVHDLGCVHTPRTHMRGPRRASA